MVQHLVGLQAQDNLPPYLGLAARLETFDPYDVTRGLEDRSLVRLLSMRSTVHLLVADDALVLRPFTRPIHERERKVSQMVRPAVDVDLEQFAVAVRAALADGPLPVKRLGEVLDARPSPTYPPTPWPTCPASPSRWPSCRRAAAGSGPAGWSTSTSTPGSAGRSPIPTRRRSCGVTSRRTVPPPPPT